MFLASAFISVWLDTNIRCWIQNKSELRLGNVKTQTEIENWEKIEIADLEVFGASWVQYLNSWIEEKTGNACCEAII